MRLQRVAVGVVLGLGGLSCGSRGAPEEQLRLAPEEPTWPEGIPPIPDHAHRLDACVGPKRYNRLFTENRNGVRDPILFASAKLWIGPPCNGPNDGRLAWHGWERSRHSFDEMLCDVQREEQLLLRPPVALDDESVLLDDGSVVGPGGSLPAARIDGAVVKVVAGATDGRSRLLQDDAGRTWCVPGDVGGTRRSAILVTDVPVPISGAGGRLVAALPRGGNRWSVVTCDRDGVSARLDATGVGRPIAVENERDPAHFLGDGGNGPEVFVEGADEPLPVPVGYTPSRLLGGAVVATRTDGSEALLYTDGAARTFPAVTDLPTGLRVAAFVGRNSEDGVSYVYQNTGDCPFLSE